MRSILLAFLSTIALGTHQASACSTFCTAGDNPIFGKNYDWMVEEGLLIINKRGVEKEALSNEGHAARWVSRFGSVTFNQYGRELPSGGINEAGLVIELMWLADSEYAEPDERPGLGNLQWIQYQLDRHATVDEVIRSDTDVRISALGAAKIHFLVADPSGRAATIEFLDGRLVAHSGASLPVRVLTNDTYTKSLAALESKGGVESPPPVGSGSLTRFERIAKRLAEDGESTIDFAFATLADAAQGDYTKWSIVYDLGARTVHFRSLSAPARKFIRLADVDFACDTPVRTFTLMRRGVEGDLSGKLQDYAFEDNLGVMMPAYRGPEFLRGVPDEAIARVARYPEAMVCVGIDETSSRQRGGH